MAQRIFLGLIALLLAMAGGQADAEGPATVEKPRWRPMADDVYLQEVGRQVATDAPVQDVARIGGAQDGVQDSDVLEMCICR